MQMAGRPSASGSSGRTTYLDTACFAAGAIPLRSHCARHFQTFPFTLSPCFLARRQRFVGSLRASKRMERPWNASAACAAPCRRWTVEGLGVTEQPDAEEQPLVFVIDDDPSIRAALADLLRSVGLDVLLFESTQAFLASKRPDAPSCIVLDVRLPGPGGLDLQRKLASSSDHPPIVFITGHGDVPMCVQAMKDGAIEFLTKPFRDQELLDAINLGIERDRARRQQAGAIAQLRERFESLTARERQIMAHVVTGRMNKQIAGDLDVSEITVKVHRGQAMRKMGAKSFADLVRMADKLGLSAEQA
jgi:FixJ family two-component response regulator